MTTCNCEQKQKFDLAKALAGAKVVTREGDEVEAIFYTKKNESHPVCIFLDDSFDEPQWYTKEGIHIDNDDDDESESDLFMAIDGE